MLEEFGFWLDVEGFVFFNEFVNVLKMVYFEVMEEFVREIVENDLKGCYEIWGDRIRVCYGYSFLVSFDYEEDIESCFLYYGIFWRNLFLILEEGLKLMKC